MNPLARPKKRQKTNENGRTSTPRTSAASTGRPAFASLNEEERQAQSKTITTIDTMSTKKAEISIVTKSFVHCVATVQVHQASRLVAQQLHLTPELTPGLKLQQLSVMVEHFGRQVFLPYILAQEQRQQLNDDEENERDPEEHTEGLKTSIPTMIEKTPLSDRIFYATLLALREVLAQNASRLFQLPKIESAKISNQIHIKNNSKKKDTGSDEQTLAALVLATTVVLAACEAAGKDDQLLLHYLQDQEFPFLEKVTPKVRFQKQTASSSVKVTTMTTTTTTLSKGESVAYAVGYNMAVSKHRAASAAKHERNHLSIPEPTTCWVSVVEEIPSSVLKNNATRTSLF